ncbi:hypothetical protein FocTR4_00001841, partial [Fusarium oxysporum f. sp. cubense]
GMSMKFKMEHRSLVQGEAGALSRQRMVGAGLMGCGVELSMGDFQFIRLGANANYNQETLSQDSQTILDEVFGRHTYTHTSAIEAGLRGLSGAFVINWHKL